MKIYMKSLQVIENYVESKEKPKSTHLVCDPVETLDDLLEWELELDEKGCDYAIGEVQYTPELVDAESSCSQKSTGFVIFSKDFRELAKRIMVNLENKGTNDVE